ncbi:anti-sigma regulatory factor (Ser/Thr protein kinase) [Allocatelliglobosispora scoriae]|uniref:Anti-sigma regulatory factor (Ser/Thr protein kinase) n=1 Tax=Allocatelliglobosispora scoriae TaxID=643052 RepID=A0A841C114_9ACTN|nr:ATP-binding protein [Allocatelliglobosispora scoriae]MBB5873428.1 anti-sigma regulatory factor (Ser/Thr protein kinase) [Allocatelliglobosispora scoriae]
MSEPAAAPPAELTYQVATDLQGVRSFVHDRATLAGLTPSRADLLTLAVSELATNTLQHTSGGGLVRVWTEEGAVICEVEDGGRLGDLAPPVMPQVTSPGGRGLAIVDRICDRVTVVHTAYGVRHRLVMDL